MPENNNGWGEWSRHVLAELIRLNDCYEKLNDKLGNLYCQSHKQQLKHTSAEVVKLWKLFWALLVLIVGIGLRALL